MVWRHLNTPFITSLPSRERGLKFENYLPQGELGNVAPFTGAWIEIDQ